VSISSAPAVTFPFARTLFRGGTTETARYGELYAEFLREHYKAKRIVILSGREEYPRNEGDATVAKLKEWFNEAPAARIEFNVGDKTMAAGEYAVRKINPSSDRVVLQIRSETGDATVLVQTNPVRARNIAQPVLAFNRYGTHYFFSMASLDGSADAWQASKSRAEKGTAKELADLRSQTAMVALSRR